MAVAYESMGVEPTQAAEYAEDQLEVALVRLERHAAELQADGRSTTWVFNPSDSTYLQGACFIMTQLDDAGEAARKKRLLQLWQSTHVIAELDPLDFERLCTLVLRVMGASEVFLTPRRADQGIDFFGRLSVRSELAESAGYPPLLDHLSMWVIGQAKQFQTSQVATFDLRELIGSIELAKAKAYGTDGDRYPSLGIRVADPVIALFFTSGLVSREARLLARASGVLTIDGQALAHMLAHASVGFDSGGNFDRELFLQAVRVEPTPKAVTNVG